MRLNNVEYVVEVIKPRDGPTTVGLTLFSQKEDKHHVQVNNTCLCGRGIDLHDVAYRMALVLGGELSYHALRNNCDVVATWLTTGQTRCLCRFFKRSLEDHCACNACLDNSPQELWGSQVND